MNNKKFEPRVKYAKEATVWDGQIHWPMENKVLYIFPPWMTHYEIEYCLCLNNTSCMQILWNYNFNIRFSDCTLVETMENRKRKMYIFSNHESNSNECEWNPWNLIQNARISHPTKKHTPNVRNSHKTHKFTRRFSVL